MNIDQAMSSYIARHRLGRKDDDTPVTQDAEVKKEMDKVFQEFMVLSGIDPATMMLKSNEQFSGRSLQVNSADESGEQDMTASPDLFIFRGII